MYKFLCEAADEHGNGIPNTGCGEIDFVLFDGYSFGDRLLEGVMFKLLKNGTVETVEYWPTDPYLRSLNENVWVTEARRYAQNLDIGSCPHCNNDVPVINE